MSRMYLRMFQIELMISETVRMEKMEKHEKTQNSKIPKLGGVEPTVRTKMSAFQSQLGISSTKRLGPQGGQLLRVVGHVYLSAWDAENGRPPDGHQKLFEVARNCADWK